MRLAIGDRVLVDIPVVNPSTREPVLNDEGEQEIVSIPAKVKVFEEDEKGRILTTFTFPSGKDSIPYTRELVKDRIVTQNLKISDKTEVDFS